MLTSTEAATTTSSDTAVDLITNSTGYVFRRIVIANEGSVGGFFSYDGGKTWGKLPAFTILDLTLPTPSNSSTIKVKRIASGSNLASVWGFAL